MHTPIAAGHLLDKLLVVHGALAYLIVGALAFGEAALFVGFVLPGETVGRASIGVLVLVVVAVIAVHLYRRRAGKRAQADSPADYPDEPHPDRPGPAPAPTESSRSSG